MRMPFLLNEMPSSQQMAELANANHSVSSNTSHSLPVGSPRSSSSSRWSAAWCSNAPSRLRVGSHQQFFGWWSRRSSLGTMCSLPFIMVGASLISAPWRGASSRHLRHCGRVVSGSLQTVGRSDVWLRLWMRCLSTGER